MAEYRATAQAARPGDAFEVSVHITWAGTPDAYAIAPPRPTDDARAQFTLLRSESGQDGQQSFLHFVWMMSIEDTGIYALSELLPVIARHPDSPKPIRVEAVQPVVIHSAAPTPLVQRLGWAAGMLLLGGGTISGVVLIHRRRAAAIAANQNVAQRQQRFADLESQLAAARKLRLDGNVPTYLQTLRDIAEECGNEPACHTELSAMHERVTYAHYTASSTELDRLESLVRRRLDTCAASLGAKE